ncbi:MAG: SDR family oxidoreductase [Alphaproteobacteria bacterium]|nr:SDR family oxidoreductase [Alphaproteobacteria bacterium]
MDLELRGRRALVIGSTRGLGRAIAGALAAEGATVALTGRVAAAADAAAADVARESGTAGRGYALDLADPAGVAATVARALADLGGIDILVTNSGGPPTTPIAAIDPGLWQRQFQMQFLGLAELARAVLPGMRERQWGRVLLSLSSGAVQPIANLGISNTIRGAWLAWAKTLANEVAADGVTVNTILPGRIHTERVDEIDRAAAARLGRPVDAIVRESIATIPAGRYGTVEEYAAVATFLVSGKASYVTGSQFRVDGGYIRAV